MGFEIIQVASVLEIVDMILDKMTQSLIYAAEKGLNRARVVGPLDGSYRDRTGNLRSSIGYVVFKDSKEAIEAGFLPTEKGSEKGTVGQKEGRQTLKRLKTRYGTGYSIIMVAGMDYSGLVEANYDVLSSAEKVMLSEFDAIAYRL